VGRHQLPRAAIEAYPDVANNYVQIITQWPGRSAEEIERQVTVPIEIQMAGIPTWPICVPPRWPASRA